MRLGLAAATISLTCLQRMADRAAALRFLGGETFDAAEAERVGLVTRSRARGRGRRRGGRGRRRAAAGHAAGTARDQAGGQRAELLAHIDAHGEQMATLSARLFASDESRAAMRAFLERR